MVLLTHLQSGQSRYNTHVKSIEFNLFNTGKNFYRIFNESGELNIWTIKALFAYNRSWPFFRCPVYFGFVRTQNQKQSSLSGRVYAQFPLCRSESFSFEFPRRNRIKSSIYFFDYISTDNRREEGSMESFHIYDVIHLTRARGKIIVRRPNPSLRRTEAVRPRLINFSRPASASVPGWPFSSRDPALDIDIFDRHT